MISTKENWVVVKYIVAATGFKRKDARRLLGEIPEEFHAQVFMAARAWDREASMKAAETLSVILQSKPPEMLIETTRDAATRFLSPPAPANAATSAHRRRPNQEAHVA